MPTKYEAVHTSPSGPGDGRPTALQIVQDEKMTGKLIGKTVLITGCSSGIGVETARALYSTGATLYLTARNIAKLRRALADIVGNHQRVHLLQLDLDSLDSVRACATEFLAASSRLNVLIQNAGVMACPEGRTKDGYELHFGINHLAHFLLFYLLKDTLLASATLEFASRVVILSSSAHRLTTKLNFNNNVSLLPDEEAYDPWKAYSASKLANIFTANEIERRYGAASGERGLLHAYSVHPGSIVTELARHVSVEQQAAWDRNETVAKLRKNAEQGAATTVWAAIAPELEGRGGEYLENCAVAGPCGPGADKYAPGYAIWARNSSAEARLWAKSVELLDLE
ncbi:hypothetical protein ASPCAL14443 [Aspergillus calidoustus]|uniref:Short-chain dehydrogenase n=1 Tax=Aspergillus calidoustus TaxID=454130 RepID=A0A0U5CJT9_ASPCI|nr:hypothetical protein ASPCAL14443 [Aspergillus calidoustus]